jgi:hypothetical protein
MTTKLKARNFQSVELLADLRTRLSEATDRADDVFAVGGAVHALVALLGTNTTDAETATDLRLLAAHCVANLWPLSEANGLQLARSAGPYLIMLLAAPDARLREASAIAVANMALAGARLVKVLLNQEVMQSLADCLQSPLTQTSESAMSATLLAIHHILHVNPSLETSSLEKIALSSRGVMSTKAPVELSWVLFALSCNVELHQVLVTEEVIGKALHTCTYEIFQKSDSRPLVRIVTPLVRLLANLCAGPKAEQACLLVLRHPDLQAILMALLGTNYTHLCRETLWMIRNVINSDSVLVQEELIELDILDKMEYFTSQAVQRIDPYLTSAHY